MSKLLLFDFECGNGHVSEELVQPDTPYISCPNCSLRATKLIPIGHINYRVMGVDPDFPTAGEKWGKLQEQKSRLEKDAS